GEAGKPALDAHATLVKLVDDAKRTQERDLVLGSFNRSGVLGAAVSLYRLAIEKQKPDAERESGYQQRDLPVIEGSLKQMERRYVAAMDRQLQQYWLDRYVALPAEQHVAAVDGWLGGSDKAAADKALARLDGSKLGSLEERLKWFNADKAAFEASTDPAIQYAVAVMPTLMDMEKKAKAVYGTALQARPLYLQAMADYKKSKGEAVYPDANSSLRITF